jgi:hypothetical protein
MKQHSDRAPPYGGQGTDQIQEVQQGAVAMKDLMVAQRVEVAVPLEAAGEPAEGGAALDERHVGQAALGEGEGRGHAGEPPAKHHDGRRVRRGGAGGDIMFGVVDRLPHS